MSQKIYINELSAKTQEKLYDSGYSSFDDDWLDFQGEELLSNMYGDPDNMHADWPGVFLGSSRVKMVQRKVQGVLRHMRVEHFCWNEQFDVVDSRVLLFINGDNVAEMRKKLVDDYGLTPKQFLLLVCLYDDIHVFVNEHARLSVECDFILVEQRIGSTSADQFHHEDVAQFWDDHAGLSAFSVPMLSDTKAGDLFPTDKDFFEAAFQVCQAVHSYTEDYLSHVRSAMQAEWEYTGSFEYWLDMCVANEITVEQDTLDNL